MTETPLTMAPIDPSCKTLKEILFYKMDRTFAIAGIIILGGIALFSENESQITMAAITGLATYIGVRTSK